MPTLEPEVHPILANIRRTLAYQKSMQHWLAVGYGYMSAAYLATAKHGATEADRQQALKMVKMRTNLREEDLI